LLDGNERYRATTAADHLSGSPARLVRNGDLALPSLKKWRVQETKAERVVNLPLDHDVVGRANRGFAAGRTNELAHI
jgi:hypothetical protein